MAAEKRTASFWLPTQTIELIGALAEKLDTTQGQILSQAIEALARQEGIAPPTPADAGRQRPPRRRPPRIRQVADPPGPIVTKYNNDTD